MSAPLFGLICEGPTDYTVLRHVLAGFFEAPDVTLNELQPVTDQTGGLKTPGGWVEVLRFCASPKFEAAFQFNDYLIIQLDSDCCEEKGFDVPRRDATGREYPPPEMASQVRARIIQAIGADVYERRRERILFAVCVESLECWLLPLYYSDGKRKKTVQCLRTLNEKLDSAEGFTIDPKNKHVAYYRKIARPLAKKNKLHDCCQYNPSFQSFIDELTQIGQPRPPG